MNPNERQWATVAMVNYLRITGLKVGVILNFRRSSLEWERIVLDRDRKQPDQMPASADDRNGSL